jgi:hypothetical protein
MKIQQNTNVENLRYATLEQLQNDLERKGFTHQILHKTKGQVATGGAGATIELEESATENIADIGSTELTLILASDTNDNAYDTKYVIVYYLTAAGVAKTCKAVFNTADSTTEVAFTDLATGLVAVTDFYCFDPSYGVLAVVSNVAVQAGDNVVIGITGAVAGIADPETCYAHINAGQTTPLAADMYGVGSIWGSTAANQDDAGYIGTLEYVTPWGQIKSGTWTIPADGSVATRFVSVTDSGLYVNDFYRRRDFKLDNPALDESRISNVGKSAIYAAIDIGKSTETFTRYYAPYSTQLYRAWIGRIELTYPTISEYCNVTISFTNEDGCADTYVKTVVGHSPVIEELCIPIEPNSEVTFTVVDDAATGGTLDFETEILEVLI